MATPNAIAKLWRLTPLIAIATAIALLISGLMIVYYGESTYRAERANDTEVQAQILSATVVAALTFNDRPAAKIYAYALSANPQIEAAAVYDAMGELFAVYRRNEKLRVPAGPPETPLAVNGDNIAVTMPVAKDRSLVGYVYVRTLLEPLSRRYQRYAVIALLVIMAALVTAVLGIAQSALARTNRELASSNTRLQSEIAERVKAEEALRQAQKMEAIGQLTGGVAHDFNNILQVILGNLGTVETRLQSGGIDAGVLNRSVKTAIRAADRAATLTAQLLAFSRRQPLSPQTIDANRLVTGMSEMLHRSLGETIEIETVLGARLWQTMADPNQLESAILNLAVNARDAMPSGGKLTIETANIRLDEAYADMEEDVTAGQYVMIAVSDTGAGMPPEVVKKAFDPFFTTKEIGKGTGLGLSQVYGFIKQSGGHAKIYSEPGEGTTIKLYLPRLISAAVEEGGPAIEPPPPGTELVLVVEDEPDVRSFVVDMLHDLGYRVLDAANAHAALQILDRRNDISLLFTDVGLPGGVNGRQLAEQAKRRHPEIKILYTTGYARNAIVHQGRLDPGVELINKPFTYAALAARLREVLEK
jgi:signal transduction histidine kinase